MKLKLGTDDTFDCPEGKYRATLERVGEPKTKIKKKCQDQVRFTFRVKMANKKEHLVARTFCADLSYGSELYQFLDSWLDEDFEPYVDENGEIDLDLLIDTEADVLITHNDLGTHRKPFVQIAGIFPVGKLLED